MPCDVAMMFENKVKLPFFAGDINDKKYRKYIDPKSYITPQVPPFLILHGTEDPVVPFEQGQMFYDALIAQKIDAKLVALEGEGHAGPQFFQQPLWDMIAGFFKDKLK